MDTKVEYKNVKAEIYNYRCWARGCEVERMLKIINESLEYSGYNVLEFVDYKFPVKGYTSMWLLAESHMALHYFADEDKYYLELSGCCELMSKKFKEHIQEYKIEIEEI